MNFSWLEWKNTPWGKATGGQWRYALRNSIAMILALYIAFEFQMDEPYWALTSAAVVSFPTVGGVISKSIGRIIGSLLGAMGAVFIAGHCLNEPWLFTLGHRHLAWPVYLRFQPLSKQRLIRFRAGRLHGCNHCVFNRRRHGSYPNF